MPSVSAKVGFSNFVDAAARAQLPVGFLQQVRQSRYMFDLGASSSYVLLWRNLMVLERNTLAKGTALAAPLPYEFSELGTLYRESAHAWLDLMKDDPTVAKLIREESEHYKDAPLKDRKETADNPERLLYEAMGTYVGHRISTYWHALETLTYLEAASRDGDRDRAFLLQNARAIRAEYGRAMGERVFGYQPPPGFFGRFSNVQVDTTKVISDALKNFCDRKLLEDKISDQFERQKTLMDLWSKLRALFPELQ